jgi:TRAP-type C4-dicarboxylate transport system permease small subunit
MNKLYQSFCVLEELVAKVLLAFIVLLVFLAALSRTLSYPINWSVDIAQLLFAWTTFFGADIAMRKDKLMGVDLFIAKMSPKSRDILRIGHYILIIVFLCGVVVFGLKLCFENYDRTFQTMEISYSWVTLSVPVGSVLMIITSCLKLKQLITSIAAKQAGTASSG